MPDSYQLEIDRLTAIFHQSGPAEFQNAVFGSWNTPGVHGELFGYVDHDRCGAFCEGDTPMGCLTQVHYPNRETWSLNYVAPTAELTAAIRADDRIPNGPSSITHPDQLAVFREWQLRLDAELGREPPIA